MSSCETVRTIFNLACPKCGSDAHLRVAIDTWAELSTDGTDPVGDHEWNEQSSCRCTNCEFKASVKQFTLPPTATPPPLKSFEVTFYEHDKFAATIQAIDKDTALAIAQRLLDENGPNLPWDVIYNERDDFEIEEVRS